MGDFYRRLRDYYTKVGAVLRAEADSKSIFPNSTDAGMSREAVYARVLAQHVPSSCNVFQGGFLFGRNGDESGQIDILITDEASLRFAFMNPDTSGGKEFACIDGCIAAISVKSMLNTNELNDALTSFAALPEKQAPDGRLPPLLQIPTFSDWPFKIVFAYDGIKPQSLLESVMAYYGANPTVPRYKRPNLIHVAGKYMGMRVDHEREDRHEFKDSGDISYHFHDDPSDAWALLFAAQNIQQIAQQSKNILLNYTKIFEHFPPAEKENGA